MKKIILAVIACILTLLLPFGWQIPVWTACVVFPIFYLFSLPKILANMADNKRLIDHGPEENHWRSYHVSGRFKFSVTSLDGAFSFQGEYNPPTFLANFFARRGLIWLGFNSPSLITRHEIILSNAEHKRKSLTNMASAEEVTEVKDVHTTDLRLAFDVWDVVPEIETTDGKLTTWLIRARVRVNDPFTFVYGQSRVAYEALKTGVAAFLVDAVEDYSLIDFLYDPSTSEIEGKRESKKHTDDTESGEDKDPLGKVRDQLEAGFEMQDIGATVIEIIIDSWTHNADEAYLKTIRGRKEEALANQRRLEQIQNEAKVAQEEAKTLKEKGKTEEARRLYNRKMTAAVRAACDGDEKVMAEVLLLKSLGEKVYTARMMPDALKETKVAQLVMGGDVMSALLQAIGKPTAPTEQPTEQEEEKPKKKTK